MRDCDIYDHNGRYCGRIRNNAFYDDSGLFGCYRGEMRGNDIYDESGHYWGIITSDGSIYKGISPFGEYVGKIKDNGDIYDNGGYSGRLKYASDVKSNSPETKSSSSNYNSSYGHDPGTIRNGIIGFIVSGALSLIVYAIGFGFIRLFFFFFLTAIIVGGSLDFYGDMKKNIAKGNPRFKGLIGEIVCFVFLNFLWLLLAFA